ncbi:N-acetylglutaminylglutamine synthetase [Isoptericola sp. b490]|uniref:N-acetylglutaminylglutamine synthetase n=1 Tax=Actinotalea lenta TaxID=3064654 RepID=UPI0027143B10|nr:N-acetylglutaminylglutamine synthetase [Isoptericola sp. b490]MDO8121881.1 N-acetylglutaminylglutamine synthetase [Isoptericola sp. b490]
MSTTDGAPPTPRQDIGPGGDPVMAAGEPDRDAPDEGVVLDCGWGRIVFGQTFARRTHAAEVLRSEAAGARDICMYLRDAHVFVAKHSDEFFVDPSLTYRLDLTSTALDAEPPPGVTLHELTRLAEADAVNAIYARNQMVTAAADVLVDVAERPEVVHLVAELSTGEIIGTVTGVDHGALFDDPANGSSLWCLTVDPSIAPPGVGQALLAAIAREMTARGRSSLDLSVLADNTGAIRLYERLGFRRVPDLVVKRKNPINERLFRAAVPDHYEELNPYARLVADEAMRRGIRVEVTDGPWGELRLTHGARTVHTRESLSELTSALAMARCDDKRVTRRVLSDAGLRVPRGATSRGGEADRALLAELGQVVVKPARGEQGRGITVGVRDPEALERAVSAARAHCPDVLIEEMVAGQDLRVIVIDHEVVAAAVRRPAAVIGDGVHTVADLIERQSRRRSAATGGESRIPVDAGTLDTVAAAGWSMDDVLPDGEALTVRRTANLHTGGTIHDVTAGLHPVLAEACVAASRAIAIPVTGLDLLVAASDQPEYVIIEANERPGLANHEPQPTAERFMDLLFPTTAAPPRLWTPRGHGDGASR